MPAQSRKEAAVRQFPAERGTDSNLLNPNVSLSDFLNLAWDAMRQYQQKQVLPQMGKYLRETVTPLLS